MLRAVLAPAFVALLPAASLTENRLAEPSITLRIGYLKGTTDLTLAKAHGSLEAALDRRTLHIAWAGPFAASAGRRGAAVELTGGSSMLRCEPLAPGS